MPRSMWIVFGCSTCAFLLYLSHRAANPRPSVEHEFSTHVLSVRDQDDGHLLSDARLKVFCLGGTPVADAEYKTDQRGAATVYGFKHASGLGVRVTKAGYEDATIWVWLKKS